MLFPNLLSAIQNKQSPLVMGLDPVPERLPSNFVRGKTLHASVRDFCLNRIEQCANVVAAVKPNAAFFEALGPEGWRVFWEVSEAAKQSGLFVIADAKRGDVPGTARAYARAFFSAGSPFDFLTISAALGTDTVMPFLEAATEQDRGLFALVRTSNAGASEFQDLPVGDSLFHEEIARAVARLGADAACEETGFSRLGAVVGCTAPEELRHLRNEMPQQLLLVPGLGAQGGGAADAADAFFADGSGALVAASRSIIFADEPAKAAQTAQASLWEDISKKSAP